MADKFALFAFNGDPMCFIHVILNARSFKDSGHEVAVIIEGSATKLVESLAQSDAAFHNQYIQFRDDGFITCVCEACATKMGAIDAAREQNLDTCSELMGHPSMARFVGDGYTIITF